jgi:hypothetical protein
MRRLCRYWVWWLFCSALAACATARGPNGGPWNAAWDKFIRENDDATQEEIFRYAGQLIYEFELFGPVGPYWRRPSPKPPGYKVP